MSRNHTFKLCSIALLSALSVVFNAFAINFTQDISVSFTYIVCFVAGVFLGPVEGFTVGVIGDLIGCLIAPKGPYAPTITLSSGLLGLLPWLLFRYFKKLPTEIKIILSFVLTFLICSVAINTTTWYIMYNSKTEFFKYIVTRNSIQIIVVAINCALTCIVFRPIAKVLEKFGFYYPKDKKEKVIENDSPNN